jgi:GntR family transcriptional regulator, transcriptional repressor for pyruvate dehydrogenase complex
MLDLILSNKLQVGDRLPSERELGEQFGVSRTVIREAVRGLATKGVIDVRTGSGLRVAAVESGAVSEMLGLYLRGRQINYDHVHDVRLLLEVHVAGLAATRATKDDIDQIAAVHAQMAREISDVDAATKLDLEFHRAIARATHNDLYLVLMDSIGDFLLDVRRSNLASGYGDKALAQHDDIVARITDHDREGAQEAMATHLEAVAVNLRDAEPAAT